MKSTILAALLAFPLTVQAADYSLQDRGDFLPSGHRVEFADRYGWDAYEVKFDFGLDSSGRALAKDSKLSLRIFRRDGGQWRYSCGAKGPHPLEANVNFITGKGISVLAECRIAEDAFAKAVGLHHEDVGLPHLVFQAVIEDGKVLPGAHRGLYFLPGGQIESSELGAYASRDDDPSNLAVSFRSN